MKGTVARGVGAGFLAGLCVAMALSCDYGDLDHIPPGFADGVDNDTTYIAGDGLTNTSGTLDVDFAGSGSALTAAKSDHDHAELVPQGAIIMWSGTLAEIPSGWQLCDGTGGAPDLRDRFILGTADAEEPGSTGGAHSPTLTTAQTPQHVHSFTTGNNDVNHAHEYDEPRFNIGTRMGGGQDTMSSYSWSFNLSKPNNRDHKHSGSTNAMPAAASFDNRPAYYKLAFIIKL